MFRYPTVIATAIPDETQVIKRRPAISLQGASPGVSIGLSKYACLPTRENTRPSLPIIYPPLCDELTSTFNL